MTRHLTRKEQKAAEVKDRAKKMKEMEVENEMEKAEAPASALHQDYIDLESSLQPKLALLRNQIAIILDEQRRLEVQDPAIEKLDNDIKTIQRLLKDPEMAAILSQELRRKAVDKHVSESANASSTFYNDKSKGKPVDETTSSTSADGPSASHDIKGKGKDVNETISSTTAIPSSATSAKVGKKTSGKTKATAEQDNANYVAIQETIARLSGKSAPAARSLTKQDWSSKPGKKKANRSSAVGAGGPSREATIEEEEEIDHVAADRLANITKKACNAIMDNQFLEANYCKSEDKDEINAFYEKKKEEHGADHAAFVLEKKLEIDAIEARIKVQLAIQDDHAKWLANMMAENRKTAEERMEKEDEEEI